NEATLTVDADGALQATGSATESALLVAARAWGLDVARVRERHPLVTTSPRAEGRNWMGSMHAEAEGRLLAVKGAPEEVLRACGRWAGPTGESALDGAARRRMLSANDRMAGEGMRVLGLASRTLDADREVRWDGLTWLGLVGLIDPIRTGVREAITVCHRAGIRPVMITGDQGLTAVAGGGGRGAGRDRPG